MFNKLAPIYDNFSFFFKKYTVLPILNRTQFSKNQVILDVGGGTGYLGQEIKNEHEVKYFLVDKNKKMLSEAKNKKIDELIYSSSCNLPFKKNLFDFVLCVDALHHFNNKEKSLKEMMRVLKQGGRLIILDLIPKKFLTKSIGYIEKLLGEPTEFLSSREISKKIKKDIESYEEINFIQFFLVIPK